MFFRLLYTRSAPRMSFGSCPPCNKDLLGDILKDQNILHRVGSEGLIKEGKDNSTSLTKEIIWW